MSSGTLVPSGVTFYIYDANGILKKDCSEDTLRYNTKFTNGEGILTFNPKTIMVSGDKIMVSYVDQNGKKYPPIELGFSFTSVLSMTEF